MDNSLAKSLEIIRNINLPRSDREVRGEDITRSEELEAEIKRLTGIIAMQANAFDGLTNMPIKWYMSEREVRFVFANETNRDTFARFMIGTDKLFTASSETVSSYLAVVRAKALEDAEDDILSLLVEVASDDDLNYNGGVTDAVKVIRSMASELRTNKDI